MGRLLHARQQRGEQLALGVDEVGAVVVGELVLVGHRQRPGRAGLDAQAAEDAAQVVDLVDAAEPLPRAEPLVLGVRRPLDVDRVRRAGPGAQLAPDALLEAVGPAVELVAAVEPGRGRQLLEGVLLGDHLLEHGPEGDSEPGDRVPELFLERGHGLRPSSLSRVPAGTVWVLLLSKVRDWAAPRTGPPTGIGGTGKAPVGAGRGGAVRGRAAGDLATSSSSSPLSPSSPVKKNRRTKRPPGRRSRRGCTGGAGRRRARSPGSSPPPRSSRARSG